MGTYPTERDAARAYDCLEMVNKGHKASLNFAAHSYNNAQMAAAAAVLQVYMKEMNTWPQPPKSSDVASAFMPSQQQDNLQQPTQQQVIDQPNAQQQVAAIHKVQCKPVHADPMRQQQAPVQEQLPLPEQQACQQSPLERQQPQLPLPGQRNQHPQPPCEQDFQQQHPQALDTVQQLQQDSRHALPLSEEQPQQHKAPTQHRKLHQQPWQKGIDDETQHQGRTQRPVKVRELHDILKDPRAIENMDGRRYKRPQSALQKRLAKQSQQRGQSSSLTGQQQDANGSGSQSRRQWECGLSPSCTAEGASSQSDQPCISSSEDDTCNSPKPKRHRSKKLSDYVGVAYEPARPNAPWRASAWITGLGDLRLGNYPTQEEAAQAHDLAVLATRGLSAKTNFDAEQYSQKAIAAQAENVGTRIQLLQQHRANRQVAPENEQQVAKSQTTSPLVQGEPCDQVKSASTIFTAGNIQSTMLGPRQVQPDSPNYHISSSREVSRPASRQKQHLHEGPAAGAFEDDQRPRYHGTCYETHTKQGPWRSSIWLSGLGSIRLGSFRSEVEAAMCHDLATLAVKGRGSSINFNDSVYSDSDIALQKVYVEKRVQQVLKTRKQYAGKPRNLCPGSKRPWQKAMMEMEQQAAAARQQQDPDAHDSGSSDEDAQAEQPAAAVAVSIAPGGNNRPRGVKLTKIGRPKYKGVYVMKTKNGPVQWSKIVYGGQQIYLGQYPTKAAAARAWDCAKIAIKGRAANTNFDASTYTAAEIEAACNQLGLMQDEGVIPQDNDDNQQVNNTSQQQAVNAATCAVVVHEHGPNATALGAGKDFIAAAHATVPTEVPSSAPIATANAATTSHTHSPGASMRHADSQSSLPLTPQPDSASQPSKKHKVLHSCAETSNNHSGDHSAVQPCHTTSAVGVAAACVVQPQQMRALQKDRSDITARDALPLTSQQLQQLGLHTSNPMVLDDDGCWYTSKVLLAKPSAQAPGSIDLLLQFTGRESEGSFWLPAASSRVWKGLGPDGEPGWLPAPQASSHLYRSWLLTAVCACVSK